MHPGSLALGWGPLSALVRHQVFLVSAAGTVVAAAVLMVGGVVPLPSLVERGWHVLVPGAAQRAPHRAPAPVTRRLERGAAGSFDRRVPFAPARRVVRAVLPADRSTGRPSAQRGRAHAPVDIRPTGSLPAAARGIRAAARPAGRVRRARGRPDLEARRAAARTLRPARPASRTCRWGCATDRCPRAPRPALQPRSAEPRRSTVRPAARRQTRRLPAPRPG